jgi:hypothetical protein
MMAQAYGKTGQFIQQDWIYENGTESILGTVDGTIETHGRGMFDQSNSSTDETQPGLTWAMEGIHSNQF